VSISGCYNSIHRNYTLKMEASSWYLHTKLQGVTHNMTVTLISSCISDLGVALAFSLYILQFNGRPQNPSLQGYPPPSSSTVTTLPEQVTTTLLLTLHIGEWIWLHFFIAHSQHMMPQSHRSIVGVQDIQSQDKLISDKQGCCLRFKVTKASLKISS
jgi:hypothetical protein